uniref:Uncharacterized protein n=1 Tax=Musca domestica TaxID=7370 RepID=A0A1I8NJS8_MUSDO
MKDIILLTLFIFMAIPGNFTFEIACVLPTAVVGPCKKTIPSWSYDKKTGSCKFFNYGGCEGNSNRFKSLLDCKTKCKPGPFTHPRMA